MLRYGEEVRGAKAAGDGVVQLGEGSAARVAAMKSIVGIERRRGRAVRIARQVHRLAAVHNGLIRRRRIAEDIGNKVSGSEIGEQSDAAANHRLVVSLGTPYNAEPGIHDELIHTVIRVRSGLN